jgi:hypothetical protein
MTSEGVREPISKAYYKNKSSLKLTKFSQLILYLKACE